MTYDLASLVIFQVMIQAGVMKIPDCHIMKRWTIRAREDTLPHGDFPASSIHGEVSRTLRHRNLYMRVLELVSAGEYDETTSELAIKYLEVAKTKIAEYKCTISRTCQVGYNLPAAPVNITPIHIGNSEESGETGSCGLQLFDREQNLGIEVSSIKPPIIKKKQGRPTNKIYLTRFDTNITKNKEAMPDKSKARTPGGRTGVHQTRFCSGCKSPGHDIRTCPKKHGTTEVPKKKKQKIAAEEFEF
jgi:hypothetical protein